MFERQGLIEYNFHCFREAIQEVGVACAAGVVIVAHVSV